MRPLRRLIVGVVVLAAVLAGLDFGLRVWSAIWVGDRVQSALGMSARPSVTFGGLLVTPQVVEGHIDSATLEARDFEAGGVAFSSARLKLRNVTFQTSRLLLHHRGVIEVRTGDGVLGMSALDLEKALGSAGAGVSVRFSGDRILLSGGSLPQEVGATPSVQGDTLVISSGASGSFRIALPPLGHGVQYRGAAVAGDQALLSVHLSRARLLAATG